MQEHYKLGDMVYDSWDSRPYIVVEITRHGYYFLQTPHANGPRVFCSAKGIRGLKPETSETEPAENP